MSIAMVPPRHLLPNRRVAVTEEIEFAGSRLTATIGFAPARHPAEIFLCGAKDGSGLAAILADAALVISIALQHGISAAALNHSIGRLPEALDGPSTVAASPIGAALDLVAGYSEHDLQELRGPARLRCAATPFGLWPRATCLMPVC